MSLDFNSGVGPFSADAPRGPQIFSGRILHDSSGPLEKVEVVYEADLEHAIRELDLQEFGLDLMDGADLTKLNRPTFPKSILEKELEAERVRELIDRGLLVRSESPHATNNILVGKKRNADGVLGGCGSLQSSGC
jgi:hypothetical protein